MAATVALAVALAGLVSCRASPEERAGSEYAERVRVQGFRLTFSYVRAEDTVSTYVGPSDADVFTVVSTPGIELRPPPPTIPNTDPTFDHVATGVGDDLVDGLRCRVDVSRFRGAIKSFDSFELTDAETLGVEEGRLTLLHLTIGCRRPAPP